jgi:allantoate deiminase
LNQTASYPLVTAAPLMAGVAIRERIDLLAAISAEAGRITRVFMSPEQRRASDLVLGWMRAAGMAAREDAIGNVIGRYEGARPRLPALLIGSHLDTVRDAGRWDGPLGVVTAIACVDALHRAGTRLPFAIEVVGFADEEGSRFGATMLGSRAITGRFDPALLELHDAAGITMAEAIRAYGLDPARISAAARRTEEFLAYLELHIEQGPVLERLAVPVGCVTAIAGATRLRVTIEGMAGHAGTVPMQGRHDALAAAAACVLAVEGRAVMEDGIAGTVGRLDVFPGAVNVIPGRAVFTCDLRAADDGKRDRMTTDIRTAILRICARRDVSGQILQTHALPAAPCAPTLQRAIAAAIEAEGFPVRLLPSGAGHDAMEIAAMLPIGMIFVRCRGGISHHPDEHADEADIEAGARVLHRVICGFSPEAA